MIELKVESDRIKIFIVPIEVDHREVDHRLKNCKKAFLCWSGSNSLSTGIILL